MESVRDVTQCWKDFPLLSQKIQGKGFAYLDSAATTLKPWPVIERVSRFLSFETANVHRGAYRLSDQATLAFENSRLNVKNFINAKSEQEIIFTKGTTEGINLVANGIIKSGLKKGDSILVTELEHHSNFVPWQIACKETEAQFLVLPSDGNGHLDLNLFEDYLKKNTVKIVALTAMSNVLGTLVDIKNYIQVAQSYGALVLVDAAQAISYSKVDVQNLDVDFLVFSGHKLFAPYGVGVLYIKNQIAQSFPCYQFGGSMVNRVSREETTFLDSPNKFEAGTPNIEGVLGLSSAIDYLNNYTFDSIQNHENELITLTSNELKKIPGIILYGDTVIKGPILSFNFNDIHSLDVAQILNEENVFIRSGHHCAQPLMTRLQVQGTLRVSFSIYNRQQDVDRLIQALKKAKELLS